jgi:hemerythrin-like domain-containing protein
VHTADGVLDLSAIYVVHHAVRRDLRDFTRALPATPLTATDSWSALRRRWTGFTTALHHHTRVEDGWIWPEIELLLGPDDPDRRVLDAMPAEHAQIEPLLDAVTAGFESITSTPDAGRRALLAAGMDRAEQAVLAHLAHEETAALPLMQRHLPGDRWKAAQAAAAKEYGLSDLRFAVPWSAHEIGEDQFGVAFAHGGVLIRILLALTRRHFMREHRVAFRHIPRSAA